MIPKKNSKGVNDFFYPMEEFSCEILYSFVKYSLYFSENNEGKLFQTNEMIRSLSFLTKQITLRR